MVLRYSATHKTTHNKIHRLDALDAYNQKLVKKIARGISVKGWRALPTCTCNPSISSKKPPEAASSSSRSSRWQHQARRAKLSKGDNLFVLRTSWISTAMALWCRTSTPKTP
jgi:type III restriction enzyme